MAPLSPLRCLPVVTACLVAARAVDSAKGQADCVEKCGPLGTIEEEHVLLQQHARLDGAGTFADMASSLGPEANTSTTPACPPVGVQPVQRFDVEEYVKASWYSIQQQLVPFQPEPLECVVATYDIATKKQRLENVPGFFGDIVLIENCQRGESTDLCVNLCGSITNPLRPSAWKVGSCTQPFPHKNGVDYWVVYVRRGPGGEYKWVWVSRGAPTLQLVDGCTAELGLFLLSRTPELPKSELALARHVIKKKGFSLSRLVEVKQEGCTYEGADLKPRAP